MLGYQWCAIRFLTVQRHAMPPDEYAHLCVVRESRIYLDHANYTQKSRTPGRAIDFSRSLFKASTSYRAVANIRASNVRSIKSECVLGSLLFSADFGTFWHTTEPIWKTLTRRIFRIAEVRAT